MLSRASCRNLAVIGAANHDGITFDAVSPPPAASVKELGRDKLCRAVLFVYRISSLLRLPLPVYLWLATHPTHSTHHPFRKLEAKRDSISKLRGIRGSSASILQWHFHGTTHGGICESTHGVTQKYHMIMGQKMSWNSPSWTVIQLPTTWQFPRHQHRCIGKPGRGRELGIASQLLLGLRSFASLFHDFPWQVGIQRPIQDSGSAHIWLWLLTNQ